MHIMRYFPLVHRFGGCSPLVREIKLNRDEELLDFSSWAILYPKYYSKKNNIKIKRGHKKWGREKKKRRARMRGKKEQTNLPLISMKEMYSVSPHFKVLSYVPAKGQYAFYQRKKVNIKFVTRLKGLWSFVYFFYDL